MELANIIKIAFRNVFRQKRRSIVTILTILTGLTSILLFKGFFEANYTGLRESVIRSQYGHVQIFKKGFNDNKNISPDKYRLSEKELEKVISIIETNEFVEVFSRRLETTALIGNDLTNKAVVIRGVDPDEEALINSALTIVKGNDINSEQEDEVLLGHALLKSIETSIGSDLSIVGTTVDGTMNGLDVKVVGAFESFAEEYDERAVISSLNYMQILLDTKKVDKVVVLLDDTKNLNEFISTFNLEAKNEGLDLEIYTWKELAGYYHKVVNLYDSFFIVIMSIITISILFGIMNTMMMTVMERTKEIGVLRALGTKRKRIITFFIVEGLIIALIGSILGIISSMGIATFVSSLQIMLPAPPGASKGYPLIIELVPMVYIWGTLTIIFVAFLSSIFPANKAAKGEIVEALRYV